MFVEELLRHRVLAHERRHVGLHDKTKGIGIELRDFILAHGGRNREYFHGRSILGVDILVHGSKLDSGYFYGVVTHDSHPRRRKSLGRVVIRGRIPVHGAIACNTLGNIACNVGGIAPHPGIGAEADKVAKTRCGVLGALGLVEHQGQLFRTESAGGCVSRRRSVTGRLGHFRRRVHVERKRSLAIGFVNHLHRFRKRHRQAVQLFREVVHAGRNNHRCHTVGNATIEVTLGNLLAVLVSSKVQHLSTAVGLYQRREGRIRDKGKNAVTLVAVSLILGHERVVDSQGVDHVGARHGGILLGLGESLLHKVYFFVNVFIPVDTYQERQGVLVITLGVRSERPVVVDNDRVALTVQVLLGLRVIGFRNADGAQRSTTDIEHVHQLRERYRRLAETQIHVRGQTQALGIFGSRNRDVGRRIHIFLARTNRNHIGSIAERNGIAWHSHTGRSIGHSQGHLTIRANLVGSRVHNQHIQIHIGTNPVEVFVAIQAIRVTRNRMLPGSHMASGINGHRFGKVQARSIELDLGGGLQGNRLFFGTGGQAFQALIHPDGINTRFADSLGPGYCGSSGLGRIGGHALVQGQGVFLTDGAEQVHAAVGKGGHVHRHAAASKAFANKGPLGTRRIVRTLFVARVHRIGRGLGHHVQVTLDAEVDVGSSLFVTGSALVAEFDNQAVTARSKTANLIRVHLGVKRVRKVDTTVLHTGLAGFQSCHLNTSPSGNLELQASILGDVLAAGVDFTVAATTSLSQSNRSTGAVATLVIANFIID